MGLALRPVDYTVAPGCCLTCNYLCAVIQARHYGVFHNAGAIVLANDYRKCEGDAHIPAYQVERNLWHRVIKLQVAYR